jgi:hypothetical protein
MSGAATTTTACFLAVSSKSISVVRHKQTKIKEGCSNIKSKSLRQPNELHDWLFAYRYASNSTISLSDILSFPLFLLFAFIVG